MCVKWKFPYNGVQKQEKGEQYFCTQRSGNPASFMAKEVGFLHLCYFSQVLVVVYLLTPAGRYFRGVSGA